METYTRISPFLDIRPAIHMLGQITADLLVFQMSVDHQAELLELDTTFPMPAS